MEHCQRKARKVFKYNYFRIFYGYPWTSEYLDKEVLKKLMNDVQNNCEIELRNYYHQEIFIDIQDLQLKEGEYLPPQLRKQIGEACAGIFDLSDRNPNVYYELGHMHGANKRLLVLREHSSSSSTDLEGIVEIRYDKKNLLKIQLQLTSAICRMIHELRDDFQWDGFLWEGFRESPIKIYLGWKPSEPIQTGMQFTQARYLSRGDVQVMNLLRRGLATVSQERVHLENHAVEFTGAELSANILSIGGPRRNACTSAILDIDGIRAKTNYEFVESKPDADGFIGYYIHSKSKENKKFHTKLRLENPKLDIREHIYGYDYGLIYKLTAPGEEPIFTWIILAGITREGTLACLDCLLNNRYVQRSIIDYSLDGKDIEMLVKISVINGKHMTNPELLDVNPLERWIAT